MKRSSWFAKLIPYARMPRSDFDAIIEYLAGGGRVLGSYESYGKIVVETTFRVADRGRASIT